ncbi:Endonuclease NucS [subsurface metagenome]
MSFRKVKNFAIYSKHPVISYNINEVKKMILQKAIKDTKKEFENIERKNEEYEVIEKYGSVFNPNKLDSLTKEGFKSFLLIKNNKHWEGIHRQGNMITQDMGKLKKALKILLNEELPIEERLNILIPKNKANYIKGLHRSVVTPIMLVVYPKIYGVYNKRSHDGLTKVGLMPKYTKGETFSRKYIKINQVLNSLALENNMSLFELDSVWWRITEGYKPIETEEEKQENEEIETGFALEMHLRRFLVDNWEKTQLGKNYEIISEDGEIIGEEYQTKEVGNIDILAKDKKKKEWVVIELKKGQSNDAVIGQTLRYMGWVEKNIIKKGESIKGIIIVKEVDNKLKSALSFLKNKVDIDCFAYNVQFSLNEVEHF